MASLDNILKDLDDLDDDDDENDLNDLNDLNDSGGDDSDEANDDHDINEDDKGGEADDQDIFKLVAAKHASSIGNFRNSSKYKNQMKLIETSNQSNDSKNINTLTSLQTDLEYNLILDFNKFILDIDEEIAETYRFVVDTYSKKFPELESLIPNKMDYIKTVLLIGNETDMTLIDLHEILPSSTVMVVSVTGSTTNGIPLNETELSQCIHACHEILALYQDKLIILQFIELHMNKLAPNLCICIGSRIAAQLVGLAGGVIPLSKIPACNVEIMGQEKRNLAGFSNVTALPHTGILYQTDLVQKCPHYIRRKVLSLIANKVVLLARIDSYATSADKYNNIQGQRIRQEIEEKIEKLIEPTKARTKKALPIPEEKKRNKRGGKRVRRQRERYAMTEMRAQQNRISFNPTNSEYGDSAMGLDMGMLGKKDTGKIRAVVKKEVSLVKKQKKDLSKIQSSMSIHGLSSSLVFTPVQGMELVNPDATQKLNKVKEANNKWFNNHSGFMSAAPK